MVQYYFDGCNPARGCVFMMQRSARLFLAASAATNAYAMQAMFTSTRQTSRPMHFVEVWCHHAPTSLLRRNSHLRHKPLSRFATSLNSHKQIGTSRYLIHWRGEHKEGYSETFRQWEFLSALSAVTQKNRSGDVSASDLLQSLRDRATFTNCFSYDPYKRSGELHPSRLL